MMPSIKFWSLLAIAWFTANGIVRSATGVSLPYQPRTLGALGIALMAVLFSAVSGPPYAVLFLIVTSWAFVLSLRKPVLRPVRIIGAIALLACAGLAFQSTRELRRTPTRAERIARLGETAFGRHEFALLRREEPTSLGTYRELLRLGDSTLVINVAERIAVIGEPQVDLPLLEQALNRFAADDYTAGQIVLAMQKLRAKS